MCQNLAYTCAVDDIYMHIQQAVLSYIGITLTRARELSFTKHSLTDKSRGETDMFCSAQNNNMLP